MKRSAYSAQQAFTLIELMVALVIFAMLILVGWQVFDSVNKTKERTKIQANQLADLQYAYLQMQQDFAQMIPETLLNPDSAHLPNDTKPNAQEPQNQQKNQDNPTSDPDNQQNPMDKPNPDNSNEASTQDDAQQNTQQKIETLRLAQNQVQIIRFADADPRYQFTKSLQKVGYFSTDDKLIRRQYFDWQETQKDTASLNTHHAQAAQNQGLDSLLLADVREVQWQVLLPNPSNQYPNASENKQAQLNGRSQPSASQMPKGITVSFVYHEQPITWTFVLGVPSKQQSQPQSMNP